MSSDLNDCVADLLGELGVAVGEFDKARNELDAFVSPRLPASVRGQLLELGNDVVECAHSVLAPAVTEIANEFAGLTDKLQRSRLNLRS